MNPDPNRIGLEYFKLFNSANRSAAKKMARIEFRRPRYVYHENNEGKEIWTLNSKERKHLMMILNSKSRGVTNWQNAIIQWNLEKGLSEDRTKKNLFSSGKLKYPEHLPYDLKMPNYQLLSQGNKQNGDEDD